MRLHPLTATLLVCAVLTALFTAGFMAQHFAPTQASIASAPPSLPPPAVRLPGIGDPARDGKFEFVVSRVDCSHAAIGKERLERTAKGRFCVISLTVRNITAEDSQYFLGHAQKVFAADDTSYGYDELASIYASQDIQPFAHKLNAGESMKVKLVFDVPRTTKLTTLELHDSLLSGGTEITLT